MNYLKALGILRLVSEQADARVRAKWADGVFTLESALDREALIQFLAEKYCPTPVLSPWNGDGGFLTESGASFETIDKIEHSTDPRLQPLRDVIAGVRGIDSLREFGEARERVKALEKKKKARTISTEETEELSAQKARVKSLKEGIVFQIRSQFPDQCLNWLDACMLIEPEGFAASPLLGSGGVDGRLEFSANFLANVLVVLGKPEREKWLCASLFESGDARLVDAAVGQFAPGRIGGPNATQGMEGSSLINPWDFVLMIEGSLFLAGAVSRKLNVAGGSRAAFPFTVRAAAAGQESLAGADSNVARGEIWLPLWHRATAMNELRTLFSEGRAEVNGRQSRDGVEFARAIAGLGVDRGIESFSRQGFLRRNGLAFLATPLGRFSVRRRGDVDLLRQIDRWLGSFRAACGDTAPGRFTSVLRQIERSIFDYCRYGGARFFQRILIALGSAEQAIAGAPGFREKAKVLRPLSRLSSEWVTAANDGSEEFAIAIAIASIRDGTGKVGPLRTNLEPVTVERDKTTWAEKGRAVVWNAADLSANLAAVLGRRVMDGLRTGSETRPLGSLHRVPLEIVARFLADELDPDLIAGLTWGLMLCESPKGKAAPPTTTRDREAASPIPRAFALLKLLFLDLPETQPPGSRLAPDLYEKLKPVRPQQEVLALLRSGDVPGACRIAVRRLSAAGLLPLPHAREGHAARDHEWEETSYSPAETRRLSAALLFPLCHQSIDDLHEMTCRPLEIQSL